MVTVAAVEGKAAIHVQQITPWQGKILAMQQSQREITRRDIKDEIMLSWGDPYQIYCLPQPFETNGWPVTTRIPLSPPPRFK